MKFKISHSTLKDLIDKGPTKTAVDHKMLALETEFAAWRILQDLYYKWTGEYLDKNDKNDKNDGGPALI